MQLYCDLLDQAFFLAIDDMAICFLFRIRLLVTQMSIPPSLSKLIVEKKKTNYAILVGKREWGDGLVLYDMVREME